MIKKTLLEQAGLASLVVGMALASAPAFAQQATAAAADAAAAEETIVVTGSRIARRDLDTAAPLAVVSGQEFKNFGAVNVENIVNALPQVVPGTTAFSNNPGGGVATLNLRGLGATRTSVLVNGRRWMFYNTAQIVDLNTIPQFLIEGVETITGGASAVYGSDAIAGVVNFKLKNLEGFQANVTQSLTERGDGNRLDMNIAFGGSFADGRGHATVYGSYYNRKPIFAGQRPFSQSTFADRAAGGFQNGGSGTIPQGRIVVPQNAIFRNPAVALPPAGTTCANDPGCFTLARGGTTVFGTAGGGMWDSGTGSARPYDFVNDPYNYAPVNYLMVPQERYLLGGYADYEISKGVTAYMEVAYVQNDVRAQLAPTPVSGTFNVRLATVQPFLSATDFAALQAIDANETAINAQRAAIDVANGCGPNAAGTVVCTALNPATGQPVSPLGGLFGGTGAIANGAGVISADVFRRVSDINPRINNDERNAFRLLVGFRGDLGSGWRYDAYYSYARTRNSNVQEGNVSRAAFQRGLDGSGTALDIFGPGTLSTAMGQAISIIAQNQTTSSVEVAQANVGGPLFNLGWGADDVAINTGVEYRRMTSQFIPDTALSSGDVIGFNAANATSGGYHAKEVFGEIVIPVASGQSFFEKLEFTGAARYSDYSLPTVGGVWTYAIGGQWSPIKDITFRGQYSHAVRAPNVGELFAGGGVNFPQATDPCTRPAAAATGALRNTCIATGVPAFNLGGGVPSALQTNTQLQARTGGNPNLNAEEADTWTLGVVLRPSFIPRLSITVDYFNIEIGNAIATAGGGAANILTLCYDTFQNASNGFCQLITRNAATGAIDGSTNPDGSVASIFTGVANLSSLKTRGFDIGVDYTIPMNFGIFSSESRINLNFLGSIYQRNTFTPVRGQANVIECAGFFGSNCGTPQGKFQSQSRLTWMDGPLTTNLRWRYLSAVTDDAPLLNRTVERIPSYSLFDLSFAYDLTDNVSITAGVNNLFDKKPPILGTNQEQGNTFPSSYDVLGRDYFISVGFRF
ncbi:MAG: TonB-dependent receptor [Alphaproteobacteria bacterium]|nr:TonB-dependent receptor [Alphaproteobacteria bacterium]